MIGFDYSFAPHPTPAQLKANGAAFVCRYMSPISANDTNGKNLQPGELAALRAAGLSVVVVEEGASDSMKGGHAAGVLAGQHAAAVTKALGMPTVPVYFACDWDATEADQTLINAYLQGAASVIGLARTGIYGGFYPVSRAAAAKVATWFWQTEAWSGGQWFEGAHIRQRAATATVAGFSVDHDDSMKADFGQWPRPAAPKPASPEPQEAVYAVNLPRLAQGATGNWVRTVQALAGPRRNHPVNITGTFDGATAGVVRNVQQAVGLPVTGVVDEATWKALLSG